MVALLSMMLASPAVLAAGGTVIESFGSTSLVQVGNNFYFYPVGGNSGPQFKYGGSAVSVGRYPFDLHRSGENGERLSSRTSRNRRGPVYGLEYGQQWQCRFNGTGGSWCRVRVPCLNHSSPVSSRT